jgi:CubicO group peptidase (beta-lactamase class C family)
MTGTAQAKLLFKPGTRLSYQSTGILALATILERTAGMTIGHFLYKNIFMELGMGNSQLGIASDDAPPLKEELQGLLPRPIQFRQCLIHPVRGSFKVTSALAPETNGASNICDLNTRQLASRSNEVTNIYYTGDVKPFM